MKDKKIVVIGGTGLIGSKLVGKLKARGYHAVPAAPDTGVNALTGQGLDAVLEGASVLVDVSNSPSFEDKAVMDFFTTSTRNLLAAAQKAGVRHYVALSVVGTDRLQASAYFRAKQVQETLIRESSLQYSIVHATQFFEFVKALTDGAMAGNAVHFPPVLIQPMAANDVATAVEQVAVENPVNGIVEVGGPEQFVLPEFVREGLVARGDRREVIANPSALYWGATLSERTLVPERGARLGATRFKDWLQTATISKQ